MELLPLLAAWLVAVIAPGPDFLAVLRTAAAHGRRPGVIVGLGVTTAIGCWATLALTGLSLVLARHPALDTGVRAAGAVFLMISGGRILWTTWRSRGAGSLDGDADSADEGDADRPAGRAPRREAPTASGSRPTSTTPRPSSTSVPCSPASCRRAPPRGRRSASSSACSSSPPRGSRPWRPSREPRRSCASTTGPAKPSTPSPEDSSSSSEPLSCRAEDGAAGAGSIAPDPSSTVLVLRASRCAGAPRC